MTRRECQATALGLDWRNVPEKEGVVKASYEVVLLITKNMKAHDHWRIPRNASGKDVGKTCDWRGSSYKARKCFPLQQHG